MADVSDRLMDAIEALETVADELTPEHATSAIDEATLQVFWRKWPNLTSWAGVLWRRLNDGLGDAATPHDSGDREIGGSE